MARQSPPPSVHPTERIEGHAPAIVALRAQIRHLAPFDAIGKADVPTLLLHGETGTGKGLVAQVMHESGPRADGTFIEVNCAALPETLLEAELFGFEAGAFTDAKRAKPGLFEAASGGILFLDEIDALPLPLQGKFLKAIEEKRVRRLGAVADRPVDVKIIAATAADLNRRVAEERFRVDLYHRLAVVVLEIPPLRERGDDVIVLGRQLLRHYAEAHGVGLKRLSEAAEVWLARYPWPGNVRELSHLMERVTLLSPETIIDPETLERLCLPRLIPAAQMEVALSNAAHEPLDEPERIRQVLARTGGNVVRAAQLLGLSRNTLRYRMQRYGIERPRWREGHAAESRSTTTTTPARRGDRQRPEREGADAQTSERKPPPTAPEISERSRSVGEAQELAALHQEGADAAARGAHGEAVACFEQALTALQHVPEDRDTRAEAIDLRLRLGKSLVQLGEFGRVPDHLQEALSLAEALDDYRRLGRVYAWMTFTSWLMGDHERAIAPGRRALAIARALGDFAPQVKRNLFLGQVYLARGDYQQALESFRRNVASLENDRRQDRFGEAGRAFVMTHVWMVWCLAELGAFAEGIGCGEEGVRLAAAVHHPCSRAAAVWGLGVLYVRKGDLEKAIPLLERSLELYQGSDGSIWFPWIASALGSAYALSGRAAEALPLLEQAVQQADSMGMLGQQSLRVAGLSEAYLLGGRIEDALQHAERALELARAQKERGHEAHVLRLLGEIAAHREPPDVEQAGAAYRQARALAEELGMRPLVGHCHLGLGVLLRRSGELDQGRSELAAAIELFRILDMTFWVNRAETAVAQATSVRS